MSTAETKNTLSAPRCGSKRNLLLGVLIVALLQTSVLGWMVYDRVQLLANGRQIILPIIPVDPRALFRGDYVRLSYGLSRLQSNLLSGDAPVANQPIYVTLQYKLAPAANSGATDRATPGAPAGSTAQPEAKPAKQWIPVAVRKDYAPAQDKNHIVLKGRPRSGRIVRWPNKGSVFVRYGIEKYFLQEGTGHRLEKLARKRKLSVLIAVDSSGNAAIKGLLIDGKLQYEEPLF